MTSYVRRQLEQAMEQLAGNRPHLAADCIRRALDGLERVESLNAALSEVVAEQERRDELAGMGPV